MAGPREFSKSKYGFGEKSRGKQGKAGKEEGKGGSRLRHLAQTETGALTPEVPGLEGVGWDNKRSGRERRASESQVSFLRSSFQSEEKAGGSALRERFQEGPREEALQNFLQSDTASCPKLPTLDPH